MTGAAPVSHGGPTATAGRERTLVEARGLTRHYRRGRRLLRSAAEPVRAVEDLWLSIRRGETLGLVGESGCGKSTTGRLLLSLIRPTNGEVLFEGERVESLRGEALSRFRRRAQIVFQDPFASLNPRQTVESMLREVLRVHRVAPPEEIPGRIQRLLERVGLAGDAARRYPHEFSGGQRQRIGIARALCVEPEFIVADEPVSALDVSVQAQVLNLLRDLQAELGLTYLFIAHDLSVVRHMSDRIAVMYLGRVVELSPAEELYRSPLHPYTTALLSAIPRLEPSRRRERIVLAGEASASGGRGAGCPFYPRCQHPAKDGACLEEVPPLEEKETGRFARCVKTGHGRGQAPRGSDAREDGTEAADSLT